MNNDEKKGMGQRIKGDVKEAAGRMTGDEELELEGKADQVAGRGREKVGEVTRKAGEKLDDLGDRLKK